jgi:hypothetical protein
VTPPLVSILIPAFNAARWIDATLRSALAQTWSRIEVVVVDDGSDDDTAAVVQRCGDSRVRLIRRPHLGSSAAQNEAFRQARGEFIQRLDADDLLSADKISVQMARMRQTPRAIAVGAWARFTDDPAAARFRRSASSQDLDPAEWLRRECAIGLPMLQPGLWLASRELVAAAGPWDERLTLNNDFSYGVRLILAAERVRFCGDARLFYRSGNPASLASQRSPAAWRSSLQSIDQGATAMLAHAGDDRMRLACANLFQQLAYAACLDAPDVSEEAERRATGLGGGRSAMDGGAVFRLMRNAVGWRRATGIKALCYRAGYRRVADLKSAAFRRGGGW